ncbi:MAG: aminoacyl-tRNA hydrolase [Parcubacteria group bacterium QH_9_35_7]|nr:MAG: aminoacyl-tRNA hydrolase [Parcubacteria group bacterium QH_9_35_7]
MKLIVGLGNPGRKYRKTRHNVGFMVLNDLHKELQEEGISDWSLSEKFNAKIAGCELSGEKKLLVKPMTYMNKSGEAVKLIGEYYNLTPRDLTVVHDDIDIEFGDIKVQLDKSSAGHKGVKSIVEHLNTQGFRRVRVGIKTDKLENTEVSDFVLSKFGWFEGGTLKEVKKEAVEELKEIIY